MSVKPVKTAEEVSSIAFGFMASKAMFAGLHLDVFTNLADGPKSCEKLSEVIGVPLNRIVTLMTALNGVGKTTSMRIPRARRLFSPVRQNTTSGIISAIRSISRCTPFSGNSMTFSMAR